MSQTMRFRSADLEAFPDDGKRYEIIDGELYVSKQPSWEHQRTCLVVGAELLSWDRETGAGWTNAAPGVIFADDDDVAPDIVWVSRERLRSIKGEGGRLYAAPDLVVEVLSPGTSNEKRDRDAKLKLYSRRGVREYWIVNWMSRQVEVFRREDLALHLVGTLLETDVLESPLLPGFRCPIARLFQDIDAP